MHTPNAYAPPWVGHTPVTPERSWRLFLTKRAHHQHSAHGQSDPGNTPLARTRSENVPAQSYRHVWGGSPRLLLVFFTHDAETDVWVGPPGFGVESAVVAAHVGEAPIAAADDAEDGPGGSSWGECR